MSLAGRGVGWAERAHFMVLTTQGAAPPPVDDGLGRVRVGLSSVLDSLDDSTTVADTLPVAWRSAHTYLHDGWGTVTSCSPLKGPIAAGESSWRGYDPTGNAP
jgi:hypothetical protein